MLPKKIVPENSRNVSYSMDFRTSRVNSSLSKILDPVYEKSMEQSILTTKLHDTHSSINELKDSHFIKIEEPISKVKKFEKDEKKLFVLNESCLTNMKQSNNFSNYTDRKDYSNVSSRINISQNRIKNKENDQKFDTYGIEYEKILNKLNEEKEKNFKLLTKLNEKEKIIIELQELNTKITDELESSESQLIQILTENKKKIELKDQLIYKLEQKIENLSNQSQNNINENKSNNTPLQDKNKSSNSDLTSTKNSFKNGKSSKSIRSINSEKEILNEQNSNIKAFFQFSNIEPSQNQPDFFKIIAQVLNNLVELLNINYIDEIIPKIRSLYNDIGSFNKFHESLNKAILDCSPEGSFKNSIPSLKESWKWIKNLIFQYMKLKKNENKLTITMSQLISPKTTEKRNVMNNNYY